MKYVSVIFVLMLAMGGCALQEDINILNNRLIALEQRTQKLEHTRSKADQLLDAKEQEIRMQSADIRATIREIRENLQEINGRLEQTEFMLNQKIAAMEDGAQKYGETLKSLEQDVRVNSARVAQLGDYLGMEFAKVPDTEGQGEAAEPADSPEAAPPPEAGSGPPASKETQVYQSAKQMFDKGEYDAARRLFLQFLEAYPGSTNADNAQFWIGETYYRQKAYKKAILEYEQVIRKYPQGNKVKAAMLKQGISFQQVNDISHAKLFLEELVRKYPESDEARIARKKLETFK